MTSWLTPQQAADELGFCVDTIRQWCAESDRARREGRPDDQILPGAAKASPSPKAHWRIPEDAVRYFGSARAASRPQMLDHKRRRELLRAPRAA